MSKKALDPGRNGRKENVKLKPEIKDSREINEIKSWSSEKIDKIE